MKIDKMCLSKEIYFSKEKAEANAKIFSRLRKVELRVYKCPYCKGYHLTSKPKIKDADNE